MPLWASCCPGNFGKMVRFPDPSIWRFFLADTAWDLTWKSLFFKSLVGDCDEQLGAAEMVDTCALKYFPSPFLMAKAFKPSYLWTTSWRVDITLSFSVFICKNIIDFIRVLGGLDEFIHVGCLIHSWLLVDPSSPLSFLHLINFITSICLLISRFKKCTFRTDNLFLLIVVGRVSVRSTLLIWSRAVALVFVAEAVGTPFGAYGAFCSACFTPSSRTIWGVFCLITWIWVECISFCLLWVQFLPFCVKTASPPVFPKSLYCIDLGWQAGTSVFLFTPSSSPWLTAGHAHVLHTVSAAASSGCGPS